MDLGELSGLLQPEQKIIVLYRAGGQWQTSANDTDWDFSSGTARLALIQEVDRRGQPVIIMDAHKDERFLNCAPAPFRSAICCPISSLGLLLVEDRANPRAFSFDQQHTWAARAQQLTESLKPEPEPRRDLTKPLALAGLTLCLVSVPFLFGGTPARPQPRPQIPVLSREQATAATVAESYLAGLRTGNLTGSYRLLSSDLQKRLSEPRYLRQTESWLAVNDRAWSLKYRQVKMLQAGPSKCLVQVVPIGQAAQKESWTWELLKEEEGWRLKTLPGGES
ncbi:GAF domain-containing protein [bacterium]|nr:GAF domain-containing protein [bacterium]